jgi:hypothetical protein
MKDEEEGKKEERIAEGS